MSCAAERLMVEVDGGVHDDPEQRALDGERQELLESIGFRVLRVSALDVEERMGVVLGRSRLALADG